MGEIKKDIIRWKKSMFGRMIMVDSVPHIHGHIFVKEIDKLIEKIGRKEDKRK